LAQEDMKMTMTFRVFGLAPICEGSDENDVKVVDFEVDSLTAGSGQLLAEMKFRRLGPRHYPTSVKMIK
jgi:hypothetical protein